MNPLTEQQEAVGRHYDGSIFEFESERLTRFCPVEFAITSRYLGRYIPEGSVVAEIGVGTGIYSELLARRNCVIHLVDVSQRLLDAAETRLRQAQLGGQIRGINLASATELAFLEAEAFDAALLLGPLYHLCQPDERRRAVDEAARVLKKGGILFAAGINRLSYLRDLFRESPLKASARRDFHKRYFQDGNLDPQHAPPIGFAHLTTAEEFRIQFAGKFDQIALIGTESFTGVWQSSLTDLPEAEKEIWLELVEETAATPEGLGMSDHFLYVGSKM